MAQIKFEINGDVQLSRNLRLFADGVDDLEDFFKTGIEIIEERIDNTFAMEGSNLEKSPIWAPLAESTLEARKRGWGYYKQKPNRPGILRWTGNLQENRAKMTSKDSGQLEFKAKHAVYHQDGGQHLPTRAVIDLDNATNAEIVRALQRTLAKKVNGIFGRQV